MGWPRNMDFDQCACWFDCRSISDDDERNGAHLLRCFAGNSENYGQMGKRLIAAVLTLVASDRSVRICSNDGLGIRHRHYRECGLVRAGPLPAKVLAAGRGHSQEGKGPPRGGLSICSLIAPALAIFAAIRRVSFFVR